MTLAYRLQVVPADLYGRTQHKTLHARLSEDIAAKRVRSPFVRVAPGRFLLRTLLADERIPEDQRREYSAPVRADQLKRFYTLSLPRHRALAIFSHQVTLNDLSAEPELSYRRYDKVERSADLLALRVLVVLRRAHQVFVRRRRAEPDVLDIQPPSLAMVGFVKRNDFNLFSADDLGIREAALRTLNEQLILPIAAQDELAAENRHPPLHLAVGPAAPQCDVSAIVAIVLYSIPDTPLWDNILAEAKDFVWRESSFRVNDIDAFDQWSKLILEKSSLLEPVAI